MSLALDPSLKGLDDCGCGGGTARATPVAIANRPGLPAISYRPGTHSTFLRSLLASLSTADRPALRGLSAREGDWTVALLDAWSAVADVLTFYGERIANEAYLRTATERLSVLELARAVGYELSPGVAASTWLAFTVEEAAGSPRRTDVATGTKVQSIPGPGEKPQLFETVEPLHARTEWNVFRPRRTRPWAPAPDDTSVRVRGVGSSARVGDLVLVVGAERELSVSDPRWVVRTVTAVEADPLTQTTVISWEKPLGWMEDGTEARLPCVDPQLHVLRTRATAFGHDAPDWRLLPQATKDIFTPPVTGNSTPTPPTNWPGFTLNEIAATADAAPVDRVVYLDSTYPGFVAGGWTFWQKPHVVELKRVMDARTGYVAGFTLQGHVTRLEVESSVGPFDNAVRQLMVWGASERLEPVEGGISGGVRGAEVALDGIADEVEEGRRLLFVGRPPRVRVRTRVQFDDGEAPRMLAAGDTLTVLAAPPAPECPPPPGIVAGPRYADCPDCGGAMHQPGEWRLRDADGTVGRAWAAWADFDHLPADPDETEASELAIVYQAREEEGRTVLVLREPLRGAYDRGGLTIYGNVAPATHGETVREVLGSGDAGRAWQRFALRQPPLTHVLSPEAGGRRSTLEVWVDGIRWDAASTLFGRGPRERVFSARQDAEGGTRVQFGDGKSGARLPSGRENVTAVYRRGIGREGNVAAGQLSLLLTRPLGIRSVLNPLPATGGDDPETLDRARENAPLTVLTLDRIVSLRDYEDFARTFAGVAKAMATWTWSGRGRGVLVTVAGPQGDTIPDGGPVQTALRAAMAQYGDALIAVAVRSYRPARFRVSATLRHHPAHDPARVLSAAEAALRGRFSFTARGFGQGVALSEVLAALQEVPGVVSVDVDLLYRTDEEEPAFRTRLPAASPAPGAGAETAEPAELLTLDLRPGDLRVSA
ncbi:MAG TPA: putative baseplate assembly protein [Longimicrobium sp.]|nr:putative baseplate assembly protein [Longimicrobium sp.]